MADDIEFDFENDEAPTPAEVTTVAVADAAGVAAITMIQDGVRFGSALGVASCLPGAVALVVSPSAEWSDDLAAAWQREVLGRDPVEPGRRWSRGTRGLYITIVSEARARIALIDADRELSTAVQAGRGALLVTHDPDLLTPVERAASDVRVTIPPLSASQLASVAAKVGPGGLSTVGDMPEVTPAALRLCGRPGQTAAAFLARVLAFMTETQPPPRNEPAAPGLDGLHGMDEAVAWGRALARDMKAYARGELSWAMVDRGCLLSGPPGTGKTMFAQRLAAECGLPLVATSYSEWQSAGKEGHLGELTKCLRSKFELARRKAPCLLFIDEIDSVQSRGQTTRHDDWWTAIINCLLAEMDGIDGRDGVVIVAASNFSERVDPAIRRAGRLDRVIKVGLPDVQATHKIILGILDGELAGVDIAPAAKRLIGGTGADCERAVRSARRRARHAGRPLELADLLAEVGGGADRRKPVRRTAVHESAHAVFVAATRPQDIVALSIEGGDGILGGLLMVPLSLGTEAEIESGLREVLAGRAAEEVIFGAPTAGAGGPANSDLARATLYAVSLEVTWGLGGSLVWMGDLSAEDAGRLVSMRVDLAGKVSKRLSSAYAECLAAIQTSRHLIDGLADVLMEREVLTGDEVRSVLASISKAHRKPRGVKPTPSKQIEVGLSM